MIDLRRLSAFWGSCQRFLDLLDLAEELVDLALLYLLQLEEVEVDGDVLCRVKGVLSHQSVQLRHDAPDLGDDANRTVLEGVIGDFLPDLRDSHEAAGFYLRDHSTHF